MAKPIIQQFLEIVNQHDFNGMKNLVHDSFCLVDVHGYKIEGIENNQIIWNQFLTKFPGFKIEIEEWIGQDNTIIIIGFASNEGSQFWKIPICCKLNIMDEKIMGCQIFADTNLPTIAMDNKLSANCNRVNSIGGIFFKSENPEVLKEWYKKHLGFVIDNYGTSFEWRKATDRNRLGYTAWSPMKEDTTYFAPSDKQFMINYRVQNLEQLIEELIKEGVIICDAIEHYEYGKFVHILDVENNKIELWEPNDVEYEKILAVKMN